MGGSVVPVPGRLRAKRTPGNAPRQKRARLDCNGPHAATQLERSEIRALIHNRAPLLKALGHGPALPNHKHEDQVGCLVTVHELGPACLQYCYGDSRASGSSA